MIELDDEIKQTLNLMQTDIDEGAHNELQYHLMSLLEMKRDRLVAETGMQAELELERERRSEGSRIASADHRDELECLVSALEKIADFKLLSNDGATEFSISQDRWRKFCEAQGIAASAIAQYRKEPVTNDQAPYKSVKLDLQFGDPDKPLTADEYMAGGWWCADVSADCANTFNSKGLRVSNPYGWGVGPFKGCEMENGRVVRQFHDNNGGKKQINRVGNDFYWGEE